MPWSSLRRFHFSKLLPRRVPSILAVLSFLILVTIGLSVWIEPTHAQFVEIANGLIRGVSYIIFALATLFIKITIFFLQLFILIAGYNNYINAPVVLLGWNMMRDIANMFFVVVLLVIAFGTILGLEQYEWRKSLVKLVLAAVLVNFSNLICQVIIDVAQVFTTTFLNAIVGTAGGNLINMFNFQQIYQITTGQDYENFFTPDTLMLNVFIASVIALVFAGTAMWTIGAYLIVMVARLVVLWTLIILSPLAFLFSVLPQTKSYADEIWSQFTKHVIVAPVMVFFLWLSFATFGGGTVVQDAIEGKENNSTNKTVTGAVDQDGHPVTAGINDAASYDRMANFIVAVAFLWIGIEQVQKLGVRAGGLTQGAVDFAKKTATIASGYAVGRWLTGGAKNLGVKAGKGLAYHAPLVGGKEWAERAKITGQQLRGWYYGKGTEMTSTGTKLAKDLQGLHQDLENATPEGKKDLEERIAAKQDEKAKLEAALADESLTEEQRNGMKNNLEKTAKEESELREKLKSASAASVTDIKKEIEEKEKLLAKEMGGGAIGAFVRSKVALEKQAGKVEKQAEGRRTLLFKRTSSEGQSGLFGLKNMGMGGTGIGFGRGAGVEPDKLADGKTPNPLAGQRFRGGRGGKWRFFGDVNAGVDGQDRIEEGILQAEEARARAKDFEYQTLGRKMALAASRIKATEGKLKVESGRGPMQEQIEGHKFMGERYESEIRMGEVAGRLKLIEKSTKTIEGFEKKDEALAKLNATLKALGTDISSLRNMSRDLGNASVNEPARLAALSRVNVLEESIKAKEAQLATENDVEKKKELEKEINSEKEEQQQEQRRADKFAAAIQEAIQETKKDDNFKNLGIHLEKPEDITAALAAAKTQLEQKTDERKHLGHDRDKLFNLALEAQMKHKDKSRISAWAAARAEAEKKHADTFFAGREQEIKDNASQKHVWDHEGIETPSSALLGVVEHLLGDLKGMDLPRAVDAVRGYLDHLKEKKAKGETIGFEQKAMSTALLLKLEETKIIDDASDPIVNQLMSEFGDEKEQIQRVLAAKRATKGSASGGEGKFNPTQLKGLAGILGRILPDKSILTNLRNGDAGSAADFGKAILAATDKIKGIASVEASEAGLPKDIDKLTKALAGLAGRLDRDDIDRITSHL